MSEHTLTGVSSLTVRNGDITLFMDVENFTVEVHEDYNEMHSTMFYEPTVIFRDNSHYTIRGTLRVDDKGTAYTLVKDRKPFVRTARIEMEDRTMDNIKAFLEAVKAPKEAVITVVKNVVKVEWEDYL